MAACPAVLHPPYLPAAADDCAIKSKLLVGRRGIAGTVLVHKVAGAAAAAGGSLEEVKAVAEAACANIGTIGASLTECTMFGHAPTTRQAATAEAALAAVIAGHPNASVWPGRRAGSASYSAGPITLPSSWFGLPSCTLLHLLLHLLQAGTRGV